MRLASASHLRGRKTKRVQDVPREGTKIRAAYDLFMANKGKPVAFSSSGNGGRRIDTLIDFYGLDIRNIKYGQWVLAGEWFGRSYQDYIAEHINASKEAA